MRPMSEKLDTDANDSNTASNPENAANENGDTREESIENETTDEPAENPVEADGEACKTSENVERQESQESFQAENDAENVLSEESVENLKHQSSTETVKQLSIDRDKDDDKSDWWSVNYQSLEDDKDDRRIEDMDGDPQKLILWAAEKNELETMKTLLEEDPNLVNARDNDLYTPLHRASYSNNVEVIKMLLSYDADISAKTRDGWEPLHCACKWDSIEAVSLLLQNGADVNAQTAGHITPLHLAASNAAGRRTLELLLWQPYIDPNVKNDAGDTAYDIAYRTGPLGALFEILEESVNVY
ncbi:ankyrin repeat domain-containing protein 49-like [Argiope bruennichi]|uniref:ankyrin repeat domain-containing protein 49-like n=1 Tax=Argiope bruennichi TaxID=94029 RepID=UPI002495173C|nr:ankyrin repeat domain-containing protein 49-like [Argiope bruennichi]XP_055953818.1 ankyrin repeat domain-containing protein 49-like [Argiope bruennichi]